ncbi:hypothetical protein BWQ96_03344 [Gracilariopsis chorda]|uniref:Uncharacterized protein n=1 Tax=Gracilariopsis chorda TaxID=448386 RepID=A0A2V3IXM3_9FLOR|nr:hypothetical protein BWQ96_03344 [Gracilariopsis chorda]|eukprot:PXF46815.1 hypothetical protein BWQ96_03344 [Gracilariopsis chorda]
MLFEAGRQRRKLAPRARRAKIVTLQCKQTNGEDASQLDGELRDLFDRSIRDVPIDENELRKSDRRVMEGITETGVSRMNEIVSDMKDSLKGVEDDAINRATAMIQEETDALLSKYEDQRSDLLNKVKMDRKVIQEEFTKIEQLAGNMEERREGDGQSLKTKALLVSTTAFVLAALYYAWNGFVNTDPAALTNAAVDAVVAAAAGYFLSKQQD